MIVLASQKFERKYDHCTDRIGISVSNTTNDHQRSNDTMNNTEKPVLSRRVSFGSIEIIELTKDHNNDDSSCNSSCNSISSGSSGSSTNRSSRLSTGMPTRQNIEFFEACRLLSEMRKEIGVKRDKSPTRQKKVPRRSASDDCVLGSQDDESRRNKSVLESCRWGSQSNSKSMKESVTKSQYRPPQIVIRKNF